MARIKELLSSLLQRIKILIETFESSAFFERLLNWFNSLSSQVKKIIYLVSILLVILFFLVIFYLPIRGILKVNKKTSQTQELISKSLSLKNNKQVVVKDAAMPRGSKPLSTSSLQVFQDQLENYLLADVGVPRISFQFETLSQKKLSLKIDEMTILQAQNLTYQIDSMFPKVVSDSLRIGVHPEDKDSLQLSMVINLGSDEIKSSEKNINEINNGSQNKSERKVEKKPSINPVKKLEPQISPTPPSTPKPPSTPRPLSERELKIQSSKKRLLELKSKVKNKIAEKKPTGKVSNILPKPIKVIDSPEPPRVPPNYEEYVPEFESQDIPPEILEQIEESGINDND